MKKKLTAGLLSALMVLTCMPVNLQAAELPETEAVVMETEAPSEETEAQTEAAQTEVYETEAAQTENVETEAAAEEETTLMANETEEAKAPETETAEEEEVLLDGFEDPTNTDYKNAKALTEKKDYTVTVTKAGKDIWYKYTPAEDGTYYMVTDPADHDPRLRVFDSDKNEIDWSWYNEDGAVLEMWLDAGETYYFGAGFEDEAVTGSFTMRFFMEFDNELYAYPEGNERDENYTDLTADLGGSVVLTAAYEALDTSHIRFQWYSAEPDTDGESDYVWVRIQGATKASYTVKNVTERKEYICDVLDGYSSDAYAYFNVGVDSGLTAYVKGTTDDWTDINVKPGESRILAVTASVKDGSKLTYQWFAEGVDEYGDETWVPIKGATKAEYTLKNIETDTNYHCEVYDKYGNTASVYFGIDVDNQFRAFIKGTQLESDDIYVAAGKAVTLEVAVYGIDLKDVRCEWYKNGAPVSGGTYQNGIASLKISKVTQKADYQCRVYDRFGNEEEIYFYVHVDAGFEAYVEGSKHFAYKRIEVKPVNNGLTLKAIASVTDKSKLTYQWYLNDDVIKGATKATYTTGKNIGRGRYSCTVATAYGDTDDITYDVYVDNAFEAYAGGTKKHQVTKEAAIGSKVQLKVDVKGTDLSKVSYYWYENDEYADAPETLGNKNTLTISKFKQEAEYCCVVSDGYGNNIEIYFTVTADSSFTAWAQGNKDDWNEITVRPGQKASLAVEAKAKTKLSYQWYIDDDGEDKLIKGATKASYTTDPLTAYTEYKCVVKDANGQTRTVYFHVLVRRYDAHVKGEDDKTTTISVKPGSNGTTLEVVIDGDASGLTYQWQKMGTDNDYSWETISGANGKTLKTGKLTKNTIFFCNITDSDGGTDYCEFYVTVENNLKVYDKKTKETWNTVYVNYGADLTLTAEAKADQGQLTYQWEGEYRDRYSDEFGHDELRGETGTSLTLKHIESYGRYTCVATDMYGNRESATYEVFVNNGFTAYAKGTKSSETTIYVEEGKDTTLSVEAKAKAGKLEYTWYHDIPVGENSYQSMYLYDEQNPDLVLENVTEGSEYSCEVKDQYGNPLYVYFTVKIGSQVRFTDVADPKAYYYEPVYWAVDNGITNGFGGPNLFSPNAPCQREQIVAFLWRLMGSPKPQKYEPFTDVPKSAWYADPISWAYEQGITTGLNDGTGRFGVGQPCLREQCVTFLHRAAGKPAATGNYSFTDVKKGAYYYDAVRWAAGENITVGLNDGTGRFGVAQSCSRAMIVTFLYRYSH